MPPDIESPARVGPPASWAIIFFVLLTILCTWPMTRDLSDHVQDRGDPFLEIAALAWPAHALQTRGAHLFDAPQFHPYHDTQLYQNSFFGQLTIFFPLYKASGNPVFAFQLSVLAALVLSGLCMWGYVRHLTHDSRAGLLAGTLFAFHQYRFRNLQHLQVMSIWWWPLALWGLEDFLRTRRWRSILLLAVAGVGQIYCSVYMGAMLVGIVTLRVLVEIIAEPPRLAERALWRRGLVALAACGLCVLPLALGYLRVWRQFPAGHDMDTIVKFSAAPRDYLRLGLSSVPYYWLRARESWEYTFEQFVLFPGFAAVGLALYGFVRTEYAARWAGLPGKPARRLSFGMVVIGAVGVILSFGPYVKWHGKATDLPMPALFLLRHLPGYTIFRVNTRFAFMLLLMLSVGVGIGYRALADRRGLLEKGRERLFWLVLALLLCENWNAPVPSERVPVEQEIPAVYQALAAEPGAGPILEIPVGRSLYEDVERVYFGVYHWRRLVNGYSTFTPPGYREFAELAKAGPSAQLFAALAAWDVRTLVVHYTDMDEATAQQWHAARQAPGVEVVREFDWTGDTGAHVLAVIAAERVEVGGNFGHPYDGVDVWRLAHEPTLAEHPDAVIEAVRIGRDSGATAHLRLHVPEGTVWRCPRPLGLRPATITWQPLDEGPVVERQTQVLVPLFVAWDHPMLIAVELRPPHHPGDYTLRIDCGVAAAETRVTVPTRHPTDGGASPIR